MNFSVDSSETEKRRMNFFTKKRNELQRLCKKHGIPANLKNIEMAERLSLIYKEKENPVSNGSYKDKSNVEIIILDSDSDTDVQMEAPDIVSVAEKDCNEMNNVNVEHVLDEVHSSGLKDSVREPDQFLATSPLSEVKSSDLNIHCTVDSDNTVAEKDSNEKTNVDELYSSGLKYSVGEPDQCLVTLPLIEVKCSDLNIHHMVDSGTAGGNADVSEVKSASSQQQGQEESQMTLEGEKSEDNVRSLHLEENKQMSVIKDKIEDNQEFYQPTTTDLNAHQMVDSGTADGHVDACEESKMKFTPERSYNVDTFYAEDNMQMSVNVLEHFGNYMMMGEDLYGTPVRDTCEEGMLRLSEKKFMVADPEECNGFFLNELEASTTKGTEPETSFDQTTVGGVMETYNRKESMQVTTKGSEAETYFDQTTHGDVMETYNRKESMQVDNMETENNQEFFDNSDVFEKDCKEKTDVATEHFLDEVHSSGFKYSVGKSDNFLATFPLSETKFSDSDTVAEKDSNEKTNVDEVHLSGLKYLFGEPDQCLTTSPLSEVKSSKIHHMVDSDAVAEKTNVDEVHSSGLKYLFREPDQCLTTSPLSEVKSSDLNIHHMVDSGAVAGNADACEVRSVSLQCERSENNVGSFYLEEYTQMSVDKEQIEDNQELSPATPTDLDVVHMVDSGTAAGDADDCEGKSASLQVEDDQELHQIEDDQELHQATPTVSQPSETMSCNFSLQQLFALDTCEEEMQDLSEKDKTCMVADLEACIGLLPKNLEAATTKGSEVGTYFDPTILGNVVMETYRIDNVEKEINQDDCFSAQGEVGKFFDNDDFGVDELVQTVPQPSEMESFDFSLQQLFASDTASGDEDAYQKKLDSPSKTAPTASGEKNMVFSPKLHESKMTFQCERSSDNVVSFCFEENNRMSVNMEQIQDNKELSPAPSEENLELHQAAPCEDVNVLEEYGNYMMVREDSDGMPVQFLPTSDHNIHKMVVRDTCEEDMLKLSEKTCMVADPEEHIGFSPDELEASTTKGSEAETYFDQTTVGDVSKSVENSDVYDDISGVGEEDEIQPHMTSRKRKSSDEDDTIANSDEDLKADELVPTVPQPSEMESYTFSLQQLFSSDTASGDEEAHKAKFDSPSRATPTASGEKSMVFSPKPHESSMRHKEMGIEMSLPLKRARDSIGTHDMKENIKIDKEEVGSIMSKTKFAKRQPLQDLQQN